MVRFITKEDGPEEPIIKLKVLPPPFYSKAMVFEMRLSRKIPALQDMYMYTDFSS